jgi:dTDP-4-amino-4,6-dideoxygalactose transaminase
MSFAGATDRCLSSRQKRRQPNLRDGPYFKEKPNRAMSGKPGRHIPLLDLRIQYAQIRDEVNCAIARVVESQQFILGPEVERLEAELAAYCGAGYAIGCASGSDALLLALIALGIKPGDEVLTTPYTFFATAGEIVHAGARPVFADIDADTLNLDPKEAAEALKAHPRIRAIVPVHLFGGCADMDALGELAKANGIALVEDAAQAIGAEYKQRRAGSMGDVGCFSFFPTKNLGGFGDGGFVTTSNVAVCNRLRSLRVHGSPSKYYHESVGYNSRLDALQAAILRVKLRYLDGWNAARQRNADLYCRLLAQSCAPVRTPAAASYQNSHIWNQFVIRCPRRDELREYLLRNGVGTEVYYPVPLHLQPCFAGLGYKDGDFPVAEQMAKETLALPVYPELQAEEIEQVSHSIAGFYSQ